MARVRPQASPLVTWRDGIHVRGTAIWCDARRARDVCFVSSAHALSSARHGQLIATAPTLALIGPQVTGTRLAVPYGRPFTLGAVRLELVASGHVLGSAALLVDVAGRRVLCAGAVNVRGGGLGGSADLRSCDALVVSAAYGASRFVFPPLEQVVAEVAGFVEESIAAGQVPVLLVSSPGKALDVAARLGAAGVVSGCPGIYAHQSFAVAAQRARVACADDPAAPDVPRLRRWPGKPPPGHVLLWPIQRRHVLPASLAGACRIALVSGHALEPGAVAWAQAQAAFAWSNQADHDELIQYIEHSGAAHVFLTQRFAEPLAARLTRAGRLCQALGPPRQMSLF